MYKYNDGPEPVGVVPRRRAQIMETLMSDVPDTLSIADGVESPEVRKPPPILRWLSSIAVLGAVASTLEWLKLTR